MARSRCHRGVDFRQVGDPERQRRRRVQPVLPSEVVEQVEQGASVGLECSRHLRDPGRGADAVLVAYGGGVDAVAEGLLVGVPQPLHPGEPLEAGQRLGEVDVVALRHRRQQRGRHDRGREFADGHGRTEQPAPSSAPTSSPVSIRQPDPSGSGTATAHRSASGSLASTRSASWMTAASSARSSAPGSSGLGNDTVGKFGSGSACTGTTRGAETRPAAGRPPAPRRPTPCSGV